MDKQVLLAALLGVLLVVAAVQAFQLASLGSQAGGKAANANAAVAVQPSGTAPAAAGAGQGSGFDSVPDMVGGC